MAYEELVKRLRNKAGGLEYDGWVDTAAYLEEAADAIEELTATAESYKRSMEAWADEAARAQEMLPKKGKWHYQVLSVPGGKGQTYAKWSCSRCKTKFKNRSKFCPECGAHMRGSDD